MFIDDVALCSPSLLSTPFVDCQPSVVTSVTADNSSMSCVVFLRGIVSTECCHHHHLRCRRHLHLHHNSYSIFIVGDGGGQRDTTAQQSGVNRRRIMKYVKSIPCKCDDHRFGKDKSKTTSIVIVIHRCYRCDAHFIDVHR